MQSIQIAWNASHIAPKSARAKQLPGDKTHHCIILLIAHEKLETIRRTARSLADQETTAPKTLLVSVEGTTQNVEALKNEIEYICEPTFERIVWTTHEHQPGEVKSTASNHRHAQLVAASLFEDISDDVILSKVDANVKIHGQLFALIEDAWWTSPRSHRPGVVFFPMLSTVCLGDGCPKLQPLIDFWVSPGLQRLPFPPSFISGSLAGCAKCEYTDAHLLAEDELLFAKKNIMIPGGATTKRIPAVYQKILELPDNCSSATFVTQVWIPKCFRWIRGHMETQHFLFFWFWGCEGFPRASAFDILKTMIRLSPYSLTCFAWPWVAICAGLFDAGSTGLRALGCYSVPLLHAIASMVWLQYFSFNGVTALRQSVGVKICGLITVHILHGLYPFVMTFIFLSSAIRNMRVNHNVK